MVRLKDIAEELGISVSTVSLVLNNKEGGRVNADLAKHVRDMAESLGYQPNLVARGLKTRKTHTFGFVSDYVASVPFSSGILSGAQEAARQNGYLLLVVDTVGDQATEAEAIQALVQRDVEGLIVASDYHRRRDVPRIARRLPTVMLDCAPLDDSNGTPWIVPDERQGARTATQHLLAQGHERVGYIGVADSRYIARALRLDGFASAMTGAGLIPKEQYMIDADDPSTPAGRRAAAALLNLPEPPSAVFCFSDRIAMGVLQVAQSRGLRVPEDLSIVGFDNQMFVADATLPGLTTVELPHRQMGRAAMHAALALARGEDLADQHQLIPCPLVVRDSVARP